MGQFDKHIKILGGNSRPDTFVGTWEGDNLGQNPSGTPVEINSTPAAAEKPGRNNGGAPMSPPKKISQRAARYAAMRLSTPRPRGGDVIKGTASKPIATLTATTTDNRVEKTDEQREAEVGEAAFSRNEEANKSPLRSVNGVTYDVDEYRASLPGSNLAKFPMPYDIESESWGDTQEEAKAITAAKRSTEAVGAADTTTSFEPAKDDEEPVFQKIKGTFKGRYAGQPSKAEKDVIARPTKSKRPVPAPKPQTGKVIPNILLDNAGSEAVDTEQARRDAAVARSERTGQIKPGPYGSQGISAKPSVGGKTAARTVILAAKREKRAGELAAQGKKMTTVHPAVLDLAKRIAKTHYNMTDDQIESNPTQFLSHESIKDATVAHVFGVGHGELHKLFGDKEKKISGYYGGKPLEAARRRAEAFKIADRAMRGNPEEYEGERSLMHSMIHTGSTVTQTLRDVRSGKQSDVTVNGMTPVLAENSNEGRASGQLAASKIAAEHTEAPKKARRAPRGSVAAKPEAPLGTSGRVAVRQIGQKPEEAVVREFTPREKANKNSVPTADDSKSLVMSEPKVESLDAIKEKEDTSKVLREEKDE